MPDFDDSQLDHGDHTRPIYAGERELRRNPVFLAVGIAIALIIVIAVWFVFRQGKRPQPDAVGAEAPVPVATAPSAPAEPAVDSSLPALDASDPLARELLSQLSAHPQLARWLVHEALIRRFVATVINLSEGTSPATHLRFLTPRGGFQVRASGDRWFADPASFRRYDLVTEVFYSLDLQLTAELFRTLHPLFDTAYAELGNPTSTFDTTLAFAVGNLLDVPVPAPPVQLVPQGGVFAFADRGLEQRTTAEKHLLRLGPANARRVQEKLRMLASAIGIAPL